MAAAATFMLPDLVCSLLNGRRARSVKAHRISDHPIWCLWVSKLHDMGNMGLSDTDRYGAAYSACLAIVADDEISGHLLSPVGHE
jgi:hypothetical protein